MKVLLAILWAHCHHTAFLQACTEHAARQALDNGLTCVTNNWLRISCVLNATKPLNKAPSHWLEFQHCDEDDREFECQLVKVGQNYSCSFQAKMEYRDSFISEDEFKVTLHSQRSGQESNVSFKFTFQPAYNVKPDAPSNLTVVRNSSGYVFTWNSNYERHPYPRFRDTLHYKLRYHRTEFPDEASIIHPSEKIQCINDINLETDTEYTAVVCSHPGPDYRGLWSEWSPPVYWRTKPVRDLEEFKFLQNIVLPVFVIAGILFCFFFRPMIRLKIKVWPDIPTPAPYFQPLFKTYKGDFRSWLLSQRAPGEPLKMEDVQEIDRVIEAQPLQESCLAGPSLHPCPTPYVAAGKEGWHTVSPATGPSPGDLPDTPLPLSLLKTSLAELFGSQSRGLVLAGEKDWESENVLAGEEDQENEMVLAREEDWESENVLAGEEDQENEMVLAREEDWESENVLAREEDQENERHLAGKEDWESERVLVGEEDQESDVFVGKGNWKSENPRTSLDSCLPQHDLPPLLGGPAPRQDYCTLSGPYNELALHLQTH